MRATLQGLLAAAVATSLLASGCGTEESTGVGDAAALTAALEAAVPGDEIRVAPVHMVGEFVVPAGVSIVGAGPATVIAAPEGRTAITFAGGTPATRIASLTVEVHGGIGILGRSGATAAIEDVMVDVQNGIGIGAEDIATLTIGRVHVQGTVTTANAIAIPLDPRPAEASTHGIVLVRIASATVTSVDVAGFAVAGTLLVDTTTTWNGGSSSDNRGTGLFVDGGNANVTSVRLCGAIMGGGLMPSYASVFSGGSDVHTTSVEVCDGEGYGILQSEATASHSNLTVSNMSEAGVWVQSSTRFDLTGASSHIAGNRVAGVFVVQSSNITVSDALIERTRNGTRITGDLGAIQVGDGVQLVDSTSSVSLSTLRFVDNERVGVLLDVGTGSTADVSLTGINVTGTGTALGAIAQGTTVVPGWDSGIVRAGATITNDPAFAGRLGIAGIVSPTDLPRADNLRTGGISSLTM